MKAMDRINGEGIRRTELKWALTQVRVIRDARRIDRCLLCRRTDVNEAALCLVCWSSLDDEELRLAQRWTLGVAP